MPAEAFFASGNEMDPHTGRQPVTTAPTEQLVAQERATPATQPTKVATRQNPLLRIPPPRLCRWVNT